MPFYIQDHNYALFPSIFTETLLKFAMVSRITFVHPYTGSGRPIIRARVAVAAFLSASEPSPSGIRHGFLCIRSRQLL